MISFLQFVASLAADKGLRMIAVLQFVVMVAIGTILNGCTSTTPQMVSVPTVLETTDESGVTTRVETSAQGISVSTWKSGSSRKNDHPTTPAQMIPNTSNFSRASLSDTAAPSDFTVGK
jgi:hypothetical protein